MDDLRVGDKVLSADLVYSKVYSFGHFAPEQRTTYLQIKTKSSQIEISADHMIYAISNKKVKSPIPAGEVKAGDLLVEADGTTSEVQSIREVQRDGAYAPLTSSGRIVVNGFVASNYVTRDWLNGNVSGQVLHWLQHGAALPYRLFCSAVGGCEKESYDQSTGFSPWVMFWFRLEQWQLSLRGAHQTAFLVLLAVPALFFVGIGKVLADWTAVHFFASVVGYCVWKKTVKKAASTKKSTIKA